MNSTKMFCVYDSAAGMYLEPFFCPSIEFAVREFRSAANKEGSPVNKYPADYTLFYIGEFEPESGKIEPREPTSLGVALSMVNGPQLEAEA